MGFNIFHLFWRYVGLLVKRAYQLLLHFTRRKRYTCAIKQKQLKLFVPMLLSILNYNTNDCSCSLNVISYEDFRIGLKVLWFEFFNINEQNQKWFFKDFSKFSLIKVWLNLRKNFPIFLLYGWTWKPETTTILFSKLCLPQLRQWCSFKPLE